MYIIFTILLLSLMLKNYLYKHSHTVLKKKMLLNIFWGSYFCEVKEIKQLNKEIF